jgi:hypothetical protein
LYSGNILFIEHCSIETGHEYYNQVSILPSSYFLNLVSEINVVDNKCSFRQGPVDQGLSRSFWKVQGHSGHIKESNFSISSDMKFTFYQKLIIIEQTHYMGQRSFKVIFRSQDHYVHVPYLRKKNSSFNNLNRYLITYYHVSIMYMSFRQWSLKVNLNRSRSFKTCSFY